MVGDVRTCGECGQTKPIDAFGKNSRYADGKQRVCRACTADRTRAWRKANPDKARAQKRIWSAKRTTEQRQEQRRRMLLRNPDARRDEYRRAVEKHGREAIGRRQADWIAENRDRHLESKRAWRLANPERQTEYARRYRYANDADRSRGRARKSGQRDADTAEYVEVIVRDPCSYCDAPGVTVDHIDALSWGGATGRTTRPRALRATAGSGRGPCLTTF